MIKTAVLVAGIYYAATGLFIFIAPQVFYDLTPGVAMMGPYNVHFIRDAGLAFFASGLGLAYGAQRENRDVAVFASAWPVFHALFHIWIWISRGVPFDTVAGVNFCSIQLPAWAALYTSLRLPRVGAGS